MKYGVIYYKDTDNIGDDIQTYAAYKMLPKVDYVIDREHLQEFVPKEKERVKVIANGWFNHDKQNFLFSPYIYPYLVSMHFSKNDLITDSGYKFLDGYAKEVLKKYEPVGCRDHNTEKVLNDLGYKTFFSGCLTMTIDQIGEKKEEDYICAVDLKPEVLNHLKTITNSKIKEVSHWLIFDKKLPYDEKKEIIEEYTRKTFEERSKYVLKNASLSFEQRMINVEKILKIYQNAKLVITDRIHVAIPCLALNTPVLFIFYEYNADRVETFREFLTNCTEEEFLKMTSKDLEIKNNTKYLKYRKKLKEDCKKFLEKEMEEEKLPDLNEYNEFIKRINYIKGMYLDKIYKDKDYLFEKDKEIEKIKKEKEEVIKEKERFELIVEEYMKIKNSRSWKIMGKYYVKKIKTGG